MILVSIIMISVSANCPGLEFGAYTDADCQIPNNAATNLLRDSYFSPGNLDLLATCLAIDTGDSVRAECRNDRFRVDLWRDSTTCEGEIFIQWWDVAIGQCQ